MPPIAIFGVGVFVVVLMAVFVYMTVHEIGRSAIMPRTPGDLMIPEARPWRILVATDGSPCSDRAVESVLMRPWPAESQIEVVSVVHTRVPAIPEPLLVVEAAHIQAMEEDRQRAPARVERARRGLAAMPGVVVTTTILEGDPKTALSEEAARWNADLLVVGSHGYGPVTRRILGSVSQAVVLEAPCSVEVVRCPHGAAAAGHEAGEQAVAST